MCQYQSSLPSLNLFAQLWKEKKKNIFKLGQFAVVLWLMCQSFPIITTDTRQFSLLSAFDWAIIMVKCIWINSIASFIATNLTFTGKVIQNYQFIWISIQEIIDNIVEPWLGIWISNDIGKKIVQGQCVVDLWVQIKNSFSCERKTVHFLLVIWSLIIFVSPFFPISSAKYLRCVC